MTKKEALKEAYRLWEELDKWFKQYPSICYIHPSPYSGKVQCRDSGRFAEDNCLCCGSCTYLGQGGCIIKCLECKIFLCSSAYEFLCRALSEPIKAKFDSLFQEYSMFKKKYGLVTGYFSDIRVAIKDSKYLKGELDD